MKPIPFPPAAAPSVVAPGQVTLVGTGPGDPELLTVQAVRAICAATLLLVDDLVDPAILSIASPQARIIPVGKRGGRNSTSQNFINHLMLLSARQGEAVVRLKGGDPFIFGRGGEEIDYLRAQGIPVRVVNGISAGLVAAGALGTALTHREHAHGVIFVTGHPHPGGAEMDWATLATTARRIGLTLVIYMGVANAARIRAGLLQGLPASTPVAIVENASRPEQRHARCHLGQLTATLRQKQLGSPAIIIVGNVLRGLEQLHNAPSPVLDAA